MPKYRKKPVVIEAEQFRYGEHIPFGVYFNDEDNAVIDTLEGTMSVEDGAYVITGVKGERYPCRRDIFEETYDLVEE